jgi:hypothetical protein
VRVRVTLFPIILALTPALALAQVGGGRRGNDGKADKYAPTNDLPKFPPATEVQKFNPVVYLIDQRKKMSLSDSQVTTLHVLQTKIYVRNADLIARYDSVQKIYKPENANDASTLKADSVRTRAVQQTIVMNNVLDSLMARRQQDDLDALALIADDKQKQKAADLLDKQDADFAKLFPTGAPRRNRRRPN